MPHEICAVSQPSFFSRSARRWTVFDGYAQEPGKRGTGDALLDRVRLHGLNAAQRRSSSGSFMMLSTVAFSTVAEHRGALPQASNGVLEELKNRSFPNLGSVRTNSLKMGINHPRMPLFRPFGMLNEIPT